MKAIIKLQEYGYDFHVDEFGQIKYKFMGQSEPEREFVQHLFNEIKANRAAAIAWFSKQQYESTEDIIKTFYDGSFKGAALIPVRPAYQEVLGQAVWVCSNPKTAARKRQTESELVFIVNEFKEIVDIALQGTENLKAVINIKRAFCGVISVA